jgi:hypothetical protein
LDRYGTGLHEHIVHSVVVGDDPATTCAFLLKDLTRDARWWRSLR